MNQIILKKHGVRACKKNGIVIVKNAVLAGLSLCDAVGGDSLENVHFVNCDLRETRASCMTLKNVVFDQCFLSSANFTSSSLSDVQFVHTPLSHACFQHCDMQNVLFLHADMLRTSLLENVLRDVSMEQVAMFKGHWARNDCQGVTMKSFVSCQTAFVDTTWKNCRINQYVHIDTCWESSRFSRVAFYGGAMQAKFEDCDMCECDWINGKLDKSVLRHCRLHDNAFNNYSLQKTYWINCEIHEGRMVDSTWETGVLTSTKIRSFMLERVNMSGVALQDSLLDNCALHTVNLAGADVKNTTLTDCSQENTDWSECGLEELSKVPMRGL